MNTDIKKKKYRAEIEKAAIVAFIFINFACSPKMTEEDIKKLENFDPQFKVALERKKEIDAKISSMENQIAAEKADLEAKISVLKDEFRQKKINIESQIRDVKSMLEPERNRVKGNIEKLNSQLKEKLARFKDIETMLKDTRSILEKSKDTNIDLQEKDRWDKQIYTLDKEKEKVNSEINILKEKIRLYESGLRVLK